MQLAVTAPASGSDARSITSKWDETRCQRGGAGTATDTRVPPAPCWLQAAGLAAHDAATRGLGATQRWSASQLSDVAMFSARSSNAESEASPRDSSNDCRVALQSSVKANSRPAATPHAGSSEEISYEGTHLGTQKHGTGFLTMKGCTYLGDFREDVKHGCGTLAWDDGRKYVGQFRDGKFDGFAAMSWPDGRLYRGQYAAGYKHGEGTFSWHDGRCYRGQWLDGKRHGVGLYTNAKGLTRRGTWKADRPVDWEPVPILHELEECQGGLASLVRAGKGEDMLLLAAPVKARRHDELDPERGSHDGI